TRSCVSSGGRQRCKPSAEIPNCCASTAESSCKKDSEKQSSPRLASWEYGCGSRCATKSITRSSAVEEIFCGSVVRPMRGCVKGIVVFDDRPPELGDPPPSFGGGVRRESSWSR